MLTFKGKVLFVTDETRELAVKDKNGVPTNLTKNHRFTKIQMMVKDVALGADRPLLVHTIDAPSTFVLPKIGDLWETPEVRRYDVKNGIPEVSF
jgi:hypothetical protein